MASSNTPNNYNLLSSELTGEFQFSDLLCNPQPKKIPVKKLTGEAPVRIFESNFELKTEIGISYPVKLAIISEYEFNYERPLDGLQFIDLKIAIINREYGKIFRSIKHCRWDLEITFMDKDKTLFEKLTYHQQRECFPIELREKNSKQKKFKGRAQLELTDKVKFVSGRFSFKFIPDFQYLIGPLKNDALKPPTQPPDFRVYCYEKIKPDTHRRKMYHFHRKYLAKISAPLEAMLINSSFKESEEGEMELNKKDESINAKTIEAFHKILYSSDADFIRCYIIDEWDISLVDLMVLADKYDIKILFTVCSSALQHKFSKISQIIPKNNWKISYKDGVIDVLKAADMFNDDILFAVLIRFVHKNFENFKTTQEWQEFMNDNSDCYKKFVTKLLQNSDIIENFGNQCSL